MKTSPIALQYRPPMLRSSSKPWRAIAGLLVCLFLLGANLKVQAQNLTIALGTVSDIWFNLTILSLPSDTENLGVRVWQGNNLVYDVAHQTLNASPAFKLTIGDYQPANSPFKPQTSYRVEVTAKRRLSSQNESTWRSNVTTKAERKCYWASKDEPFANCPAVKISDIHRGSRSGKKWLEFRIVPVPGANFYKIPWGDAIHACNGSHDNLGGMAYWTPKNRFAQSYNTRDGVVWKNPYTVYYCGLRDITYSFALEAYRWLPRQGNSRQAELIARQVHDFHFGGQGAQAITPTPEPIALAVGIYSASDVSVQWSAVSGATGYLLEYAGGNNESGAVGLGAGATSHSFNGLTAGGDYTVYITAYLQSGGKRRGETSFRMPAPPPTNTAVPTHTPVPHQQSPQDQPAPLQEEEQQPPTATLVPPTNTPAPGGPYASLIQTLLTYQAETHHGAAHVERWTRALAALGHGSHANPMSLAEAQGYAQQYQATRWQPVVDALTQLNPPPPPPSNTPVPPPPPSNTPVPPPPPTNTPVPPPPPSNTPVPPPPSNTPVPPPPPTNTPVPPPPPTNTPVPPPPPTNTPVPPPPPTNTPVPPPPPTNTPVPQQSYSVPNSLIQTVRGYYDENVAAGRAGKNWLRVLIAFGVETDDELRPMSASEARERVSNWSGWKPVAEALEQLEG